MTVCCREGEMRTLFIAYLALIAAGLIYFIVVGVVHR
jgi:hypothetical protein